MTTGRLFAQYPGMSAVYRQMNQSFVNQQMNMHMMMRMNAMSTGPDNPKYKFIVLMKDSTTKEVSSRIFYDTTMHKSYLEFKNKQVAKTDTNRIQKIYPDQTRQISRVNFNSAIITGIAKDSCWLFKVINGPISAYSYKAESPTYFQSWNIVAMQATNSGIEKFEPENLKKIVANDPDAIKLFDKKEYYKALVKYNKNALKGK
ncbi:MAG: hypothetical protein ABIN95_13470 [Mucilaginibacter sp.]